MKYLAVRPLRDLVLVRFDQEATRRAWSALVELPSSHRAVPTGIADVIAVGPEAARGLEAGQRVLVETMAGPRCGQAQLDGADLGLEPGPLAFVHCRNLRTCDEMEERSRRERRAKQIREEVRLLTSTPAKRARNVMKRDLLILELETNLNRMAEIDEKRKKLGRSRTIKPVKDVGLARGVMAVMDRTSEARDERSEA